MFNITNAAITPGIQPHNVKINTINMEPQPWSRTANGGKIIDKITLSNDIFFYSFFVDISVTAKIIIFLLKIVIIIM